MIKFSTKLPACLLVALAGTASSEPLPSDNVPSPTTRIIGGFETQIDQAPATVALLRTSTVTQSGDLFQAQFCAGTVIAPRWVLTAAHCVVNPAGALTDINSVLVLTGSDDLDNPVNQPIGVTAIVSHSSYRSVEQGFDIALLQLEYDAIADPVAVNTQIVGIDERSFIVGWGAVNPGDDGQIQRFPNQLRGAFVNMTAGDICGMRYPNYSGLTNETNLCAGVPEGGKDSCQGDSGGPLYKLDSTNNRIASLAGITSWGIGCGDAENPGVYTNVASYTDWIQTNIQMLESKAPLPLVDNANNGNSASLPSNDASGPSTDLDTNAELSATDIDNDSSSGEIVWITLLAMIGTLLTRKRLQRRSRSA